MFGGFVLYSLGQVVQKVVLSTVAYQKFVYTYTLLAFKSTITTYFCTKMVEVLTITYTVYLCQSFCIRYVTFAETQYGAFVCGSYNKT